MSLLTPDPGLLFWMLFSFGIVFFILAKFGFPVIVKMVEERKAYIDRSLEAAKEAHLRLEGIKEESEKLLSQARDEQVRMLRESNDMRTKIINDAKEQAREETGKIMNEAKTAIQKEKEAALRDIKQQVAQLSIDIAEKILRKNLSDKPAQMELVDKLIAEAQKN
ncbi:ATP synthase subunit b [Bacteroidia bacterium]|nr:ATP synthase subunit b [Bacteroidia bacterium]